MNGDLSRVTFSPLKHFSRVVWQQGRVQVDADGNEQTAILLHYLRALAADLIGQHGGPGDLYKDPVKRAGLLKRNCGFAIIAAAKPAAGGSTTFFPPGDLLDSEKKLLEKMITDNQLPLRICSGHYYVDGLLCENEDYWRYSQQPDLRRPDDDEIRKLANGAHLLYLDVWERHISALEDPSIREVALGGADTAARTRLIWQVRVAPRQVALPTDCNVFNEVWQGILDEFQSANRGRLQAGTKKQSAGDADDACITSPEARYRGMENQLYRVEIHQSGPALDDKGSNREDAATFKWSRDNGTIVAALKRKDGNQLIVSGLRDFSRWFTAGNWVEITHDALELDGLPGTLVRLAKVEGETLTIDPHTASGTVLDPGKSNNLSNVKVRCWDHKQPEDSLLRDGAITIKEDTPIELEDGVIISFKSGPQGTRYRSGDYWLIPARVATGEVEWPSEFVPDADNPGKFKRELQALPPSGVEHHYAPLAAITLDAGRITGAIDLRHRFPALGAC